MSVYVPGPETRILIVDDEETNLRLLTRLLEARGFGGKVSVTTSPAAALELVDSAPPDLVLLDLHMPRLDGYAILERLRARTDTRHTPVLVLTADESREAREKALSLGAHDFLTKPFDGTEIALRVRNLLEMRQLHRDLEQQNSALEKRVRERTAELWSALQSVEKSERDVRRSQAETVMRLSIAAEFRDDESAQHIHRMSLYCEMLGRVAGLDERRCELIKVASVMHDVGKLGTPDAILLKKGPLKPDERKVMEQHARIGHQILDGSDSELLQMGASIALGHHEWWDGTGYPDGRAGADIPIEARIAAIADVFDALTTHRVYRKAFPFTKAIEMLREGRGKQFDPELLDLFFDNLDQVIRIKEEQETAA